MRGAEKVRLPALVRVSGYLLGGEPKCRTSPTTSAINDFFCFLDLFVFPKRHSTTDEQGLAESLK